MQEKPPMAVIDGVLYGADAQVAVWVQERLGVSLPVTIMFKALGIIENNTIIGGCIFFNHYATGGQRDIEVSVALADAVNLNKKLVGRILNYPFGDLGLPRVTAYIAMSNARAIDQATKLGFKLEGRKRKAAADGGEVGIFGLLADECRYWSNEDEQE